MTRLFREAAKLSRPYRIDDGRGFRLERVDPGDTGPLTSKQGAKALLARGVAQLSELQARLWAQDQWALLVIFQAMDAAGKDGAIRHVMSGVNPQGVEVTSFRAPTEHELDHDYMWRTSDRTPERGRIGIFNRSYYEEVLVPRVHPEVLQRQRIPRKLFTKDLWKERFQDVRAHERYLVRNGVVVRKFFLHVSKREQKERLLERIRDPRKRWKLSAADARERQHWDDYMRAYEDMVRKSATPSAPWYVVPADNKWFTRLVVAAALIDTLAELDLRYPPIDAAKRRELREARAILEAEEEG